MDKEPQQQKKTHILNLKEKKVGNSLQCIYTGDNALNRRSLVQALRSTIDKRDLTKMKSFCKSKDTVNGTKQQPTDWKRIFAKHLTEG